jgi:hypothetical protein
MVMHVMVAKSIHCIDLKALKDNPEVQWVIEVPYGTVMFPMFSEEQERMFRSYPHPLWSHAPAEVYEKYLDISRRRKDFLKPINELVKNTSDDVASAGFYTGNHEYHIVRLRSDRSMVIASSIKVDDIPGECKIKINLKKKHNINKIRTLILEWEEWSKGLGKISDILIVNDSPEDFIVRLNVEEGYENSLAALVFMLNENRKSTGVSSVDPAEDKYILLPGWKGLLG